MKSPAGKKKPDPEDFESVHIPIFVEGKKNCVVYYKNEQMQRQVYSTCSAPSCEGKHMHVTKDRNCFQIFHSREYHKKIILSCTNNCSSPGKQVPKKHKKQPKKEKQKFIQNNYPHVVLLYFISNSITCSGAWQGLAWVVGSLFLLQWNL